MEFYGVWGSGLGIFSQSLLSVVLWDEGKPNRKECPTCDSFLSLPVVSGNTFVLWELFPGGGFMYSRNSPWFSGCCQEWKLKAASRMDSFGRMFCEGCAAVPGQDWSIPKEPGAPREIPELGRCSSTPAVLGSPWVFGQFPSCFSRRRNKGIVHNNKSFGSKECLGSLMSVCKVCP